MTLQAGWEVDNTAVTSHCPGGKSFSKVHVQTLGEFVLISWMTSVVSSYLKGLKEEAQVSNDILLV